jgi:uncharacterized protein
MVYRTRVFSAIEHVDRSQWNRLAGRAAPVMEWEYLYSLEKSGSVSADKGYSGAHLGVFADGTLVAAAPVYERDRAWVEFGDGGLIEFMTEMTGIPYREGLVAGIPFTPVPGYEFLYGPEIGQTEAYKILLNEIDALCHARGLSTSRIYFVGTHAPAMHDLLREQGYVRLASAYMFWLNRGYRDFDEYLRSFKSSRRTKIKRELRSVRQMGIDLAMVPGTEAPLAYYDEMYALYRRTWIKHMGTGFRPFLNQGFFRLLHHEFRHRSSFVVSSNNGRNIGLSLFYHKGGELYGRYWGSHEEIPFLHFSACYYFPIEYSIQNGVQMMDPGFGGEHKQIRGFEEAPVFHYLKFYGARQQRVAKAFLIQMRDHLPV